MAVTPSPSKERWYARSATSSSQPTDVRVGILRSHWQQKVLLTGMKIAWYHEQDNCTAQRYSYRGYALHFRGTLNWLRQLQTDFDLMLVGCPNEFFSTTETWRPEKRGIMAFAQNRVLSVNRSLIRVCYRWLARLQAKMGRHGNVNTTKDLLLGIVHSEKGAAYYLESQE
jgi:hypothetical protein